MRNVFAFLRSRDDPQLEREFRQVYQEPSVRYLQIGFLLGVVGFGGFYLMDALTGRLDAGSAVSMSRAALTLVFCAGAFAIHKYRSLVVRYYTFTVNLFCFIGIQGAALLPFAVHGNRSPSEFYWSLNSSLVTGVIVIYGFSRLTARNTGAVVLMGCATGLSIAALSPAFDPYYFGRLLLHILIVNVASFSLRQSVERRERQLFLLARENLQKNVYAKELELAKSRVEEANDVKMRFLSNMSHEFRTPMHGVIQTLELVGRTASGEVGRFVSKAIESSSSFLGTINSILNYTRWSQPNLPTRASTVSLSDLVRAVTDRYSQAIATRGLSFHLRLDLTDRNDQVLIDDAMLDEVIGSILGNAVKFTKTGRIDFGVAQRREPGADGEAVIVDIVVSDTGIGIPVEQQSLVYTPFYQADSGSNRAEGGAGLGLTVAHRLVEAMGGTMTFSSAVGRGSSFRVSVPARLTYRNDLGGKAGNRCLAPPGNTGHPGRDPAPLAGSVLLVEDNELNAALARELLQLMGLDVTVAANGMEGVAATRVKRFDLILMDCQMPVMDGYEATRAIRAEEGGQGVRRVPVVAVTANALAGDREKCLAAGMDDYLAKPYRAAQLRAKVALWIVETPEIPASPLPAITGH